MKKLHQHLGSAKFVHTVHLAVIAGAIVFVPLTTAQTVHMVHEHHKAKPPVAAPLVPAAKPPAITKAAAKPAPAATAPPPALAPAQSAAKTAPANPAAAAVAAAATSPGTSVHTLTPAPSAPAGSSTPPSGSSSSTSASSGGTSSASTASSLPPELTTPDYYSYNWGGYLASSDSYTAVSGSWIVPSATGNGTTTTADAAWVGIGGVTTQDLIQVGSENTVTSGGKVYSAVFYEILPATAVYPSAITISPGDSLSASVSEQSSGSWLISISDNTNGQSFSTTVSYTSSHSSAEWIEEDPSYASGGLVPFDNFGSVSFNGGATTASTGSETIASSKAESIALVNQSDTILAGPSALGSDGASFSVIRNP